MLLSDEEVTGTAYEEEGRSTLRLALVKTRMRKERKSTALDVNSDVLHVGFDYLHATHRANNVSSSSPIPASELSLLTAFLS